MDMSLLEITSRANFLIFNYIKRTLNHKAFAEQFRQVIQESGQKDIIIFKGLEDLTLVLKKYYSSQAGTAGELNNGTTNSEEPAKIALVESDDISMSKQERKKKKKQKEQRHLHEAAENGDDKPEEAEDGPAVGLDAEGQHQSEMNVGKADRKRKKKRRQLEAESDDLPIATVANGHEMAPDAASEAPVAAVDEGSDGKAPKKKRKKPWTASDESVEVKEADAPVEQQSVGASIMTAEAMETSESTAEEGGANSGKKSRQPKLHNQPYRRVREEEVINKHFHDNSFEAKPGAAGGWGHKANEDLRPTQGRSFRHEKTKKKRGSYKGGAIDTSVSSFKFGSDSE